MTKKKFKNYRNFKILKKFNYFCEIKATISRIIVDMSAFIFQQVGNTIAQRKSGRFAIQQTMNKT